MSENVVFHAQDVFKCLVLSVQNNIQKYIQFIIVYDKQKQTLVSPKGLDIRLIFSQDLSNVFI